MIDAALRCLFHEELAPLRAEMAAVRAELQRVREALGAGRWVSRREAAEALGLSVDSIDRRCGDGSLRSRRLGRAVRILIEPTTNENQIAELARAARGGNR
jgi:hypothetical protein